MTVTKVTFILIIIVIFIIIIIIIIAIVYLSYKYRLFVTAKANKQKRWQWNDFLQVIDHLHSQPITTICVAPDNRYVITGSNDAIVKVYDILDRDIQSTLIGHTKPVISQPN